tara:strand:+ start:324 stop:728 length:405 start_codon:yes stop_codon:yes gene_type:complete
MVEYWIHTPAVLGSSPNLTFSMGIIMRPNRFDKRRIYLNDLTTYLPLPRRHSSPKKENNPLEEVLNNFIIGNDTLLIEQLTLKGLQYYQNKMPKIPIHYMTTFTSDEWIDFAVIFVYCSSEFAKFYGMPLAKPG